MFQLNERSVTSIPVSSGSSKSNPHDTCCCWNMLKSHITPLEFTISLSLLEAMVGSPSPYGCTGFRPTNAVASVAISRTSRDKRMHHSRAKGSGVSLNSMSNMKTGDLPRLSSKLFFFSGLRLRPLKWYQCYSENTMNPFSFRCQQIGEKWRAKEMLKFTHKMLCTWLWLLNDLSPEACQNIAKPRRIAARFGHHVKS